MPLLKALILAVAITTIPLVSSEAVELTLVSAQDFALQVEWLGSDGAEPVGEIEPWGTLQLSSWEGHEFRVTGPSGATVKRASNNGGDYFVLTPSDAPVRVDCTLRRPNQEEIRIDVFPVHDLPALTSRVTVTVTVTINLFCHIR